MLAFACGHITFNPAPARAVITGTSKPLALNLGGIGDLTAIPPGAAPSEVVAFDTGPGNMVMDQLVARHTEGRALYDRDARLGRQGHAHLELVDQLLKDRYYRRQPPKSAGREQYGVEFVERLVATGLPMVDLIATATAFTAATVAVQIDRFARRAVSMGKLSWRNEAGSC